MEINDQLNQLEAMVRGAKAMPMSASCLVNRAETLEAIERLRDVLPTELDHASVVLAERDAVMAAGHEQAERLLEGARAEREELIDQIDVLLAARVRAATVATEAQAEAARLLADADDYVDRKLAEFEVVLTQLAAQVNNGRERLVARRGADLARVQAAAQASPTSEAADVRHDPEAPVAVAAETSQLWPT